MKYETKITKTPNGYSGYVPDLPGCVAAAETHEETERLLNEAIELHLEALASQQVVSAASTFTLSTFNVTIWDVANSLSMSINLETRRLSMASLAQPSHFGTLSAPT
jgi:predicted RNase H-like HicB family nuclease